MDDNLLEFLGDWFVKDNLREKYKWTFEGFVEQYKNGFLDELINLRILTMEMKSNA